MKKILISWLIAISASIGSDLYFLDAETVEKNLRLAKAESNTEVVQVAINSVPVEIDYLRIENEKIELAQK